MTIFSNVHYNLSPWASGTFTSGQRFYTGSEGNGSVYKCVSAGTSTTAPTGSGGSAGGTALFLRLSSYDYASLSNWSAGLPSTLTQPVAALLWNNGSITTALGAPFLTLSGHTTSSSNNITITCATGESFDSSTRALAFSSSSGVNFVLPSSGSGGINYFDIQDDNVVINGLQFQDPNPVSNSTILNWSLNITIKNCIFDGYAQYGASIIGGGNSGTGSTSTIYNTLIIDREPTTASSGNPVVIAVSNNLKIYSSLIVGVNAPTTAIGIINSDTDSGATMTFSNSMMFGYASAYAMGSATGVTSTVSYSIFDCAALTGTGVVLGSGNQFSVSKAAQFVNSATDFRLLGTSAAVAGGISTAPVGNPDIFSTTRGTLWDVGPYQIPKSPSVGTVSAYATVVGVSGALARSAGTVAGNANVSGVSGSTAGVGTANGHATVSGTSRAPSVATGTANGTASVAAYNAAGSIDASIVINPIAPQSSGVPFVVTGTYTIQPALEYVDDAGTSYTAISLSDISPLGVQTFSFMHPGVGTPGSQQLVVTDASTGSATATTYAVDPAPSAATLFQSSFPPAGPPGLTQIIPSYLYQEYADDDNLQALVTSYNQSAQSYLNWFNQINLPIYTGLSGALLDWVALGLYGIARPQLSFSTSLALGPFNTYPYDTLPMAVGEGAGSTTLYTVTDDIFKRIITWNFFKGDGFVFCVEWLKRRVMRFLGGTGGVDYGVSETYQISVQFIGASQINITIHTGSQPTTYAPILAAAIGSGACQLPFYYTYNVLISA